MGFSLDTGQVRGSSTEATKAQAVRAGCVESSEIDNICYMFTHCETAP